MKAICLRDLGNTDSVINRLFSMVDEFNPDILICLGGLFNTPDEEIDQTKENKANSESKEHSYLKTKRKKQKKEGLPTSGKTILLERLAIFNLPIIIIPSKLDLEIKDAVKRAKNSGNILYRWLEDKISTIEGWTFIGIPNCELIPKYKELSILNTKSIWCITDESNQCKKYLSNESNIDNSKFLLFPKKIPCKNKDSESDITIPSLIEKKTCFIDFNTGKITEILI